MPGNPARDLGSVSWRGVMIVLVITGVFVLLVLAILGGRSGVRIGVGNGHARPAKNGNGGSCGGDQFAHQNFLMVNAKGRRFSAGVKMVAQDINRP